MNIPINRTLKQIENCMLHRNRFLVEHASTGRYNKDTTIYLLGLCMAVFRLLWYNITIIDGYATILAVSHERMEPYG